MKFTFKRFLQYMASLLATTVCITIQFVLYASIIEKCNQLNIGVISFFMSLSLIAFILLILIYYGMEIIKFKE